MEIKNLRKFRSLVRNQLPFIDTLSDYDIVVEIGYHQELRRLFSLKQLLLSEFAPPATIRRRLSRLVSLGVVVKRVDRDDGRFVRLTLEREPYRRLRHMARLVEPVGVRVAT